MTPIQYTDGTNKFEFRDGKWFENDKEIPNAIFYNDPAWGASQYDLLKRKQITIDEFHEGDNPEKSRGNSGQIYSPSIREGKHMMGISKKLTKIVEKERFDDLQIED